MMLKYLVLILVILICLVVVYILHLHPFSKEPILFPQNFTFGTVIDDRIDLRYLKNFLTPDECHHLIEMSKDKLARSQVIDQDDNTVDKNRTSHSYYIPNGVDEIVRGIEEKISQMTFKTTAHLEGLQVVRYQPGDYFKEHVDWFHPPYRQKINNQRQYTFFVYLNDIEGAGGQTDFPHLKKEFYPKQGDALFWRNCDTLDSCYDLALHQGKAPESSVKIGLNAWIQFYPVGSRS